MARFIDPFYTHCFLDANIFDQVAGGQNEAVEEILRVYDEEAISILLPYSVQKELEDPNTPEPVRKASQNFIYSIEVQLTEREMDRYDKLLGDVAGESEPKNIARDLFHVVEAAKYGGGYFVTLDKRLLKRGDSIAAVLDIEVVTPEAFLEKVRLAKELAAEFSKPMQED